MAANASNATRHLICAKCPIARYQRLNLQVSLPFEALEQRFSSLSTEGGRAKPNSRLQAIRASPPAAPGASPKSMNSVPGCKARIALGLDTLVLTPGARRTRKERCKL